MEDFTPAEIRTGETTIFVRPSGRGSASVAGHNRGGRVAYRSPLDHPDRVERLAALDIVPKETTWDRADADSPSALPGYRRQDTCYWTGLAVWVVRLGGRASAAAHHWP